MNELPRAAYDLLPPSTRDDLKFMRVVDLSRVSDSMARARLALDVKLGNWSVDHLKQASRKTHHGPRR